MDSVLLWFLLEWTEIVNEKSVCKCIEGKWRFKGLINVKNYPYIQVLLWKTQNGFHTLRTDLNLALEIGKEAPTFP